MITIRYWNITDYTLIISLNNFEYIIHLDNFTVASVHD